MAAKLFHKWNGGSLLKIIKKIRTVSAYVLDFCVSRLCKPPKIADKYETIRRITEEGCSAARFGDGELGMICGRPLGFQKADPSLAKRLIEVLSSDCDHRLLICVSQAIWSSRSEFYSKYRACYLWRINKLINKEKTYYWTDITRFYKNSDDGEKELEYISKLKTIWEGKNIIIIEGEKSRMGIGNDLFDDAASIKRILCPAENAFSSNDDIYTTALRVIPKDCLVLIALGPTATVLAYDLFFGRLSGCGYWPY